MAYLLDTNILVRLADLFDPLHQPVAQAVAKLHRQGEVLHVTAQNLIELWNVLTRPRAANGIGLKPADAEQIVADLEKQFSFLADSPDIFIAWRTLVASVGVIGKKVHDARLAAVCHTYHISHFLTLNIGDFTRLATFGPGLVVVDPQTV